MKKRKKVLGCCIGLASLTNLFHWLTGDFWKVFADAAVIFSSSSTNRLTSGFFDIIKQQPSEHRHPHPDALLIRIGICNSSKRFAQFIPLLVSPLFSSSNWRTEIIVSSGAGVAALEPMMNFCAISADWGGYYLHVIYIYMPKMKVLTKILNTGPWMCWLWQPSYSSATNRPSRVGVFRRRMRNGAGSCRTRRVEKKRNFTVCLRNT